MVVCKFFLQGTCKFGSYCHYEHQVPSNYNYTSFTENAQQPSTSILRQANFGNAQNVKPTPSNVDINTLIKSVVVDMIGAEKGGQWFLSCYAPFKEKPAFPGFEDQSPEEIRLGFYEAKATGNIEQYKQQLQTMLQNAMAKVKALQNPSADVVAILQKIYTTPVSSFSGTYGQDTLSTTSAFNSQPNTTFAAQSTAFSQASIFGGTAAPNNTFGGVSAAQPQNNIFAQSAQTNSNQNVFGASNFGVAPNPTFGNQQSSNIFANSTFGTQVAQSNPPPFVSPQQTTNIFAAQLPQQNAFNSQPAAPQNVFAPQNTFATPQPSQPQSNIFGGISSIPSQQPLAPPSYSASIFGGTVNTNPSISFGSAPQQPVDETLYSKPEELSAEEKQWFESETLDILNIPNKPPTYDMCF